MTNHPFDDNRRIELQGSGYPSLSYIAAQLGAVSGMPDFVESFWMHYTPEPKPFGRYTVAVEFTREAFPGQFDHSARKLPEKP